MRTTQCTCTILPEHIHLLASASNCIFCLEMPKASKRIRVSTLSPHNTNSIKIHRSSFALACLLLIASRLQPHSRIITHRTIERNVQPKRKWKEITKKLHNLRALRRALSLVRFHSFVSSLVSIFHRRFMYSLLAHRGSVQLLAGGKCAVYDEFDTIQMRPFDLLTIHNRMICVHILPNYESTRNEMITAPCCAYCCVPTYTHNAVN